MARILFIHGAWHWAGCFYKLMPLLSKMGHVVVSLNNTSHGDDSTDWHAVDSMAAYNKSALDYLRSSAEPVCLIGHSMGGVTLSHLADVMPEKIAKLIYLSAFMTPPDKSAKDYILAHVANPVCAPLMSVVSSVQRGRGIAIDIDQAEMIKAAFYADCPQEDIALSLANLIKVNSAVPNVYRPVTKASLERHYIKCTQDRAIPLQTQEDMIAEFPETQVHCMATSHSPFYSQPEELAALIDRICGTG